MRTLRTLQIAVLALCALFAINALGQNQHPNLERGFSAEKVYDFADVDKIGMFDGSLKVNIPMGPVYHVNGGLEYSLKLFYNNQIWDLYNKTRIIWPEGQEPIEIPYVEAYPTHRSNAGVGWLVSLGKIFDSGTAYNSKDEWIYESPDGHDHEIGNLDTVNNTDYSHDGTYLRAKRTGVTEVSIEFPDGTIHWFDRYSTDDWRLRSTRDRFGNSVSVTYSTNGDVWTITDDHNRQQKVYFITKNVYNAYGNRLIDRVVLSGYGTGTTRTYQFHYQDATFGTSCDRRDGGTNVDPTSHTRAFLTSVDLPDGSTWEMKYSNSAGTASANCDQGSMTSLKLPTHGTIKWVYASYQLPTDPCFGSFWANANIVPGVGTRSLLDENLSDGGRVTTYTQTKSTPINWTCGSHHPSEFITNSVRAPDGGRTNYYFVAWHEGTTSPNGYAAYERGLPYKKLSDGTKLSSEFFGNCTGANCPVLRSTYSNWEFEVKAGDTRRHRNARQQFTKIVYNEDGNRFISNFATSYDGVGHYRSVLTDSNIGGLTHFETTMYDATSTDMTVDSKGNILNDVTRPAVDQPWVLNTYSYKSTTEGNTTVSSSFCFDKTTGFLQRERLMGSGVHDLLKVYSQTITGGDAAQNGKGNILSEEYYGGDDQSIGAGTLACDTSLPASARYTILHQYEFGTRKSTQYKNAAFKLLDLTIDRNTGLASEDRDMAGVLTTYAYDSLDRLKELATTGRAKMQYTYDTSASPSKVTIQAVDPVSSVALTETRVYYDFFGRIMQTRNQMPAGWSTVNTTYDASGHKRTASTPEYRTQSAYEAPGVFTPSHVTTWGYDLHDRPASELRPDNSQVTFSYVGDRQKTSTQYLATAFDQSDSAVTTTQDYDYQGRLLKVVEKSGPPNGGSPLGTDVTTNYVYDVGNRLVAVKMTAPDGIVQNRIFDYDGRGFLRWESHPEAGMTSYTYDGRGNVLSRRLGAANTSFDLNFQYDDSERLIRVEGRDPDNPSQFRVIKEFEFADSNSGTDLRQGKLVRSSRYNYKPDGWTSYPTPVVRVTETFGYNDPAGQKTDRTTTIATSSYPGAAFLESRAITQSISYDKLGRTSLEKYPMCVNCGTPPGDPWREITSAYTNGRLTGLLEPNGSSYIPSFVNSISYAANGMRSAIYHTNTIVDTRTPDPSGIARPSMIKSETYKPCDAPVITLSQPVGLVRSTTQGSIRLQLTATGSQPLSYAWYDDTVYPPTLLSTGVPYVDVAPTSTHTYYAEVTNDCRTTRSARITVKYGDCVDPWILSMNQSRNTNGTYSLSATVFGTGPFNYTWKHVPDNTIVSTTATYTTGVLASFEQYTLDVSNGCGGSPATSIVYISPPVSIVPMTLDAHKTGSNQISLYWSSVPSATGYEVSRLGSTGGWTIIADGNFTQYTDSNLPVNTVYAYRVVAHDGYNFPLGETPADIASTCTFTQIATGVSVSAAPLNELLVAVNGVRGLLGWAGVAWNNILSASDPLPDPGQNIVARHVLALRSRLNEAMQAIGVPANGYTDSDVQGLTIQAVHLIEMTDRLR